MNKNTFNIIEEAISQGIWTWLEIDSNSNSLYLEFENLQLLSRNLLNDYSSNSMIRDIDYRGELAIRFGENISFAVFYDDLNDLKFLESDIDNFNQFINSDNRIGDLNSYFYTEFSQKIKGFKFQDFEYYNEISSSYFSKKVFVARTDDLEDNYKNNDFILCFELNNLAIVVSGDYINFFNDFESLKDEDIKKSSNNWILYCLDYFNKKGSDGEYSKDLLCEDFIKNYL